MSLQAELFWMKKKYGRQIAFKNSSGAEKTYDAFYADVCNKAGEMREINHKRLAVVAGTSYEWMCYVYGALCVGKTVIVMDSLLPLDNLEMLLHNTDAEMVWTDAEDRKLRAMIEDVCGLEMQVFSEISAERVNSDEILWNDGEIIFFTSGTSSHAKGVVVPAQALYGKSKELSEQLCPEMSGDVYTPLPLYHIYTDAMLLAYLYQGRTVCLGSPRRISQELECFNPETVVAVPTIAEFMIKNDLLNEAVKVITVAGTKCEKSLEQKAKEKSIFIQNIYGSSEAAGVIALNLPGYGIDELVPAKGVEICWENGNEIVLRTVSRMMEYYKNQEATKAVLNGDLLVTGDIGQMNANGTFSPLGRKEDVIAMKNGDKLYCNEVDEELSRLEGVKEACVLYVDGRIVAVSVADEENKGIAEKAIKAYNKKQPYFRKIEDIWVRTEPLPRTRIGKLKRKEAERQYLQRKTEEV